MLQWVKVFRNNSRKQSYELAHQVDLDLNLWMQCRSCWPRCKSHRSWSSVAQKVSMLDLPAISSSRHIITFTFQCCNRILSTVLAISNPISWYIVRKRNTLHQYYKKILNETFTLFEPVTTTTFVILFQLKTSICVNKNVEVPLNAVNYVNAYAGLLFKSFLNFINKQLQVNRWSAWM